MVGNFLNFVSKTESENGASYNMHTGVLNPSHGYLVSLKDYGKEYPVGVLADGNARYIIANFISEVDYAKLYSENSRVKTFVGSWIYEDTLFLDISIQVETLDEAVKLGREQSQISIYDCVNKDVILI